MNKVFQSQGFSSWSLTTVWRFLLRTTSVVKYCLSICCCLSRGTPVTTPVHRLDPERCYKPEIFFYQNVGALLFYIVYRYIKILLSEFNLVYFSASFREKSELESIPLRFYTFCMQISMI